MTWFPLALLGYLFLAIVLVLDKFILTKTVSNPVVYTFYSTIFMFGVLLLWPFGVELLQGSDWWWAIISGVAFGLALWAMYAAVKKSEASHVNPFVGAFITIFTFGLAHFILFENLSNLQLFGMGILILASFILSFEKTRQKQGIHVGYLWAVASGLFFAVSHVSAKFIYEFYPFLTGFVWTRAFTGLVGLLLLFFPAVWRTFKRQEKKKTEKKKHVFVIVASNKVLGVLGVVLVQYAIAIGSVTMVNALVGVQYVLMFLIILFMTKFFPRLFKEYFTRRELAVEWIALILVVIGSALFVF